VTRSSLDLDRHLRKAVRHFWRTRLTQRSRQGVTTGLKDYGARSEVTGAAQMDGFADLIVRLLCRNGLPKPCVYRAKGSIELPGWFRPQKQWDLVIVMDGLLIAAIEFKSHIGPSFGNNFNNRTEEALGNATDILAAYREGAFTPSTRPWVGYLMLLEDSPRSTSPVGIAEPHFRAFEEFRDTSYADRYEILLTKLMREGLYDSACLLMSGRPGGLKGEYREPNQELGFRNFAASLLGRAVAISRTR
jgi:hypothetical protein